MIRRVPFLCTLTTFAALMVAPPAARADSFQLTLEIIDLINGNSQGGNSGFGAKQVDGPYVAAYRTEGAFGSFYPASTIKVLHHLTAMRWVAQQGAGALNTPIPIYNYNNSCQIINQTGTEPLADVLEAMMVNSSNQKTNAIQDWIGQAAINQTAHNVVGMSGWTQLNHKFGCGGPANNPANSLTVGDIILLYERYVKGQLLSGAFMGTFESLMLNQDNNGFWDGVINSAALSLGLTQAQRANFMAGLRFARKAGNWSNNNESQAGFVELPNRTCKGVVPLRYAYGVFVDDADSMTAGITATAARAMLRGEFRNAMRTFKPQALFSCIQDIKTLTPDLGGVVILKAAYSGRTRISVPPDSTFNHVLRMESASLASVDDVPYGLVDIGHGFWFTLIDAGEEVGYPYAGEAEITLSYSDEAVRGLDESSLALYRWGEAVGAWQPATVVCPGATPKHDMRGNQLYVSMCATGKYALFARPIPM